MSIVREELCLTNQKFTPTSPDQGLVNRAKIPKLVDPLANLIQNQAQVLSINRRLCESTLFNSRNFQSLPVTCRVHSVHLETRARDSGALMRSNMLCGETPLL